MSFSPTTSLSVKLAIAGSNYDVGRLAIVSRRIYFEYTPAFLSNGFEISPLKLPRKNGALTPSDTLFEGLFGVFNDSLPDGWGRLLLDRKVQTLGIAPQLLTVLDRLAFVGKFGMGALLYEPSLANSQEFESIDLSRLALESCKVLEGRTDDIVAELLELSGASAGARPKIMVAVSTDKATLIHGQQVLPPEFEHWMIKFNSRVDQKETGRIEYAYSLMASHGGVEIMPTHLFVKDRKQAFFGVQRFDRVGNDRLHMHSLSGFLHRDHTISSLDYLDILKATQFLTQDMQEVLKAYRLACFNVFSHNRDDHAKNFSYLMGVDGKWRFSPAYDLVFSNGPGGEHHTTVAGEGAHPGKSHLLQLADKFGIKHRQASPVIEEVCNAMRSWREFANEAGVSRKAATSIQRVIDSIQ